MGVGVATPVTMTWPVISSGCASQTKVYVPAVMNRHSPRQPPVIGKSGTGAVVFVSIGKPVELACTSRLRAAELHVVRAGVVGLEPA